MNRSSYAIGVFDSGVGGLTVVQQIIQRLPLEQIVYFGDTARIPYGEKSGETILRYSIENTIFLMQQNIKIVVIACNTASAYAVDKLQQIFNIPVIGVIAPGAQKAVEVSKSKKIAVLGTKGTIASGIYQKEILQRLPQAAIFPIACPLWVPLVEERFLRHAAARMIVQEYLKPLKGQNIDTILLGCTHYPLLKQLIQEEVEEQVTIVDSASTCAEHVFNCLNDLQMQSDHPSPKHRFIVSDDGEKFRMLGEEFLGQTIPHVEVLKL